MKDLKTYRLPGGVVVRLKMNSVPQMLKDKGLNPGGDAQQFHTANVLKRIKRYMPYDSGMTYKITVAQTDITRPYIITDTPYAKYLFYGKVMVDPKLRIAGFMTTEGWRSRKGVPKVLTDRDLQYNRTKNPNAGPRWDRALVAAEGKAMVADLQRYLKKRR